MSRCSSGPTTMPRIPICPICVTSWRRSNPRTQCASRGSMNSSRRRPLSPGAPGEGGGERGGRGPRPRPTRGGSGGPAANPGRGKACTAPGCPPRGGRPCRSSGAREGGGRLALWNPAARPRGGVVIADVSFFRRDILVGPPGDRRPRVGAGYQPFALRTPDGRAVPVQLLDRRMGLERRDAARHYPDQDEVDQVRIAFRAPSVVGLGFGILDVGEVVPGTPASTGGAGVRGRTLVNRFVEVTLEPAGALPVHRPRPRGRPFELLRPTARGGAPGPDTPR